MIHNNSIKVYRETILPTIKSRHTKVVNAFMFLGEASSYDIANFLNVPVHTLSGRISELSGTASTNKYETPVIEECGSKPSPYNKKIECTVYRIKVYKPQPEQTNLFQ